MATTVRLVESTPLIEAASSAPSRRFRARLIESDVWGSCGFYGASVLQEAATAKVFGKSTPIFLDHPSLTENLDRPERSVRDLAGRLVTDAVLESDGLYADIEVYPHVAPMIESMADAIGMSIRASAEIEQGEAAGRSGPIISCFHEAASVDFVAAAGAGGKVVSLLESARATELKEARNIGQWIESRIHRDFTITADDMAADGHLTREERITLSGAIGDALSAFVTRLEADASALYQRDLWDEPTDTVAAAVEAANSLPANPAGQSTTQESSGGHMATKQIEESEYTRLTEADGRVKTLVSERDTAVKENGDLKSENATLKEAAAVTVRESAAATIVATESKDAGIPLSKLEVSGLVRDLPVKEGALDEDAFTATVKEALTDLGKDTGRIRGFGGDAVSESGGLSAEDFDNEFKKGA